MRIVVFGATGRIGNLIIQTLADTTDHRLIAVSRSAAKLEKIPAETVVHDIQTSNDCPFLEPNDIIINAAHIRFTENILAGLPDQFNGQYITIGSTRFKTKFADKTADIVRAAQQALYQSDIYWTALHPTMIYHVSDENNIQRLVKFMRLFRVIPLPNGGKSLVQPIHGGDIVTAAINAIQNPACHQREICLAGKAPLTYRDFVKTIAKTYHIRCFPISLPFWVLKIGIGLNKLLPFTPNITHNEIERLLEDKDIDVSDMENILNVIPLSFEEGLNT